MKNITLAVDENTLKVVRRYAAEHDTTVNAIVRDYLARIARNETRTRDAVRVLRAMSDRSTAEVGPVTWSRDELHDR
jgi:hypothetical protein